MLSFGFGFLPSCDTVNAESSSSLGSAVPFIVPTGVSAPAIVFSIVVTLVCKSLISLSLLAMFAVFASVCSSTSLIAPTTVFSSVVRVDTSPISSDTSLIADTRLSLFLVVRSSSVPILLKFVVI